MKTILVVDDELGIANVVIAALEDEGYRVLAAPNGAKALERVDDSHPDLIVSDFMMPCMDGATMAQQIRADPVHGNIPIIIVSAMQETVIRTRCGSCDGYLRKPFRVAALLELIDTLLSKTESMKVSNGLPSPDEVGRHN